MSGLPLKTDPKKKETDKKLKKPPKDANTNRKSYTGTANKRSLMDEGR